MINIQTTNKGFFRVKNLADLHSGLKEATTLFEELISQLDPNFSKKARAVKDRLREELSQLELEI